MDGSMRIPITAYYNILLSIKSQKQRDTKISVQPRINNSNPRLETVIRLNFSVSCTECSEHSEYLVSGRESTSGIDKKQFYIWI